MCCLRRFPIARLVLALGMTMVGGCSAPEILGPPRADLVVYGPPGHGRHRPPSPVLAAAVPGGIGVSGVGPPEPSPDHPSTNASSSVVPGVYQPAESVTYGPPRSGSGGR
ncbi:hypothetical protein [Acidomonas methanolica]|uniref:Uncharacterized protein n=3 Tax=Acidomonas methanolica TaxID=437 RepID=A0A023D3R2_ACIMT|nr:hypothetical protein [Acidomonas methanolica]MBU2655001.1 hypothetical protein [Acidomonas methanolica]TCS25684.1 hypothetical protein EDC31_11751 [Acidomonas methanolica]GAJ28461.1 hypothetical protein Amme_027_012 [Acidomonas methanolica NBRC 104435]GEK99495.1 hypothetical protein AME01nite_19940 [Acidomonas methanolica NBRC 104435]